ncbi:PAS domain-containing protein [Leptolyngbya sp. GB1-A1]|uniref:PAS domain-containing protein n=1 Tax=Leptolyngbya sp. GB1-A1 TaxID=2933908 RepID=UPI00329925B7
MQSSEAFQTKVQTETAQAETVQTETAQAETVQTETAVRDRFFTLLQDLDAIVWEMDLATWQFTFVSDRAEQILGYPVQQWLSELTFWQDTLLHPKDRVAAFNSASVPLRKDATTSLSIERSLPMGELSG